MSQSPVTGRIGEEGQGYVEAWRHVNEFLMSGRSFSGGERNCCFLNTGKERFANVSSLVDFDFPDDGRGLALTDWDHDGDLDVWTSNRSAPRVRFLRNAIESDANYLALRLIGTGDRCNRDAIGARVAVYRAENEPPLLRTVRSGEGFVSQSSRVLHFGLGESAELHKLFVHWPDGQEEDFDIPAVNARYELVQGSKEASPVARRGLLTLAAQQEGMGVASRGIKTWNLLTQRVPLPPLRCSDFDGGVTDVASRGEPRLVNLWSNNCEACLQEIREWSQQAETLTRAGVDVTLVSVDHVTPTPISVEDISDAWTALSTPFRCLVADEAFVAKLQLVHDELYDHHRPLPLPTSVLIDANGQLAAIYKGPVSVERIVEDSARLALTGDALLKAALPSSGTWIAKPGAHRLPQIADQLIEDGFVEDALAFSNKLDGGDSHARQAVILAKAGLALARGHNVNAAIAKFEAALVIDAKCSLAHRELGTIYGRQNQLPKAVAHLRQAIAFSGEPSPDAYLNLGVALRRLRRVADATEAFKRAVELDPQLVAGFENLAFISGRRGELAESVAYFRQALRVVPNKHQTRVNLAIALKQMRRDEDALTELRTVLDAVPDMPIAITHICQILGDLGRNQEAKTLLTGAVLRQPQVAPLHLMLGRFAELTEDWALALKHYKEGERLDRGNVQALTRIAWIQSTCPDSSLRNGQAAMTAARRAVNATRSSDPRPLDSLAAAHAELQHFEDAIQHAELAIDAANRLGLTKLATSIRERLSLYHDGKSFREDAKSSPAE